MIDDLPMDTFTQCPPIDSRDVAAPLLFPRPNSGNTSTFHSNSAIRKGIGLPLKAEGQLLFLFSSHATHTTRHVIEMPYRAFLK